MKWIIILGVIGVGAGIWWSRSRGSGEEGAETYYDVEKVEIKDIRITVESTGEVEPRNRLDVKPPIAGRLEELMVDEGEKVTKGQILGWISSTERATLLDAALATSQEEYDYWEDLYKPSPLISPLDGTIIARNFEPGQSIASSDSVVVIADDLIIVANLDETDIGQIEADQKVVVALEAYPDNEFPCVVEKIAYDATTVSSVTMYEVDVRASRKLPPFARSGMTANLEFIVEEKEGVLTLPVSAILQKSVKGSGGFGEDRPDFASMTEDQRKAFMVERMKERGLSDAEIKERMANFGQGGRRPGGAPGGQNTNQGAARRSAGGSSVESYVLVASNNPDEPEKKTIKVGVSDGSYTEILEGLEEGDEVLIKQVSLGSKKSGGGSLFSPTMGRGPR
ncbi:efflux RND transporter periplasmic adaptor subunit [Pontiella agarivorans]|uniref:HlyD family efflux transporter periplasmic adaptor subunit n=1 Tax=Pontiella agarivorans TaxID=3038953 RepID=A0ABU5MXH7_9BACT|nr:HlyD family efflux transporter periplasmic adaptor subunit [Pontiella agarivorans]MDZ8118926.1 HlyD family efflux transporter periplasmic adaptor subunit [Pontiella agarivorans]